MTHADWKREKRLPMRWFRANLTYGNLGNGGMTSKDSSTTGGQRLEYLWLTFYMSSISVLDLGI